MRIPDWEALADVQFVLYNRVANQLNEALSGIALSDMPEAGDKPPGYWKERATNKIQNVLNMFTAWTWLMRYKMGEKIPERAIRPFSTNSLLAWVGAQLQLSPPPVTTLNPLLRANQETLQEALLLLHSVAYTQGSAVRLAFEATTLGTWFRIRFDRYKPLPDSVDALIEGFGEHWRAQDAMFELATARDFIRLNCCELTLNSTADHGEFAFFVQAAVNKRRVDQVPGTRPAEQVAEAVAQTSPQRPPVILPPETVALTETPQAPEKTAETEAASGDTPVFKDPTPTAPPPVPPTLAVLRPLPPQVIPTPPVTPPPASPEGEASPGEPEENKHTQPDAEAPAPGERALAGVDTPPQPPGETPIKPAPPAVIIPARIPEPKLPEHLRTPPASTSNVALTRDTQSMTPVRAQDAPTAGDSEADPKPASAQEESGS
jgi:hypothetical protein